VIGHLNTDEQDSSAKRIVCAVCRKPSIAHEETEQGALCRLCANSATEIRLDYVIGGRVYTKKLKRLITAVESEKRKPGAAGTVTGRKGA